MTLERAALSELLAGLNDAGWARPTTCPGWSVKDVALHLLDADFGWLSRGRDDDSSGLIAVTEDYRAFVTALNRKNELWVQAARGTSPRLIQELLAFCGPMVDDYLASVDLSGISRVSWAGPDAVPAWLDLARDFTERWVHQQQIRDAVGKPGLTDAQWLSPVLRTFVWALPHHYRDIDADLGTQLALTISGAGGGRWTLTKRPDAWELDEHTSATEPQPASDGAKAIVELPSDDAWRLFTGSLDDDRRVRLAGDQRLASWFLGTRSIII
jgi:uncharacterized protein (TIGR03083 family)